MTANSTHQPYRTRPAFGSLLFGSLGVWGGAASVISGTTKLDAGLSMTLALLAAGLGVLAVIMISNLRSVAPLSLSDTPLARAQNEEHFDPTNNWADSMPPGEAEAATSTEIGYAAVPLADVTPPHATPLRVTLPDALTPEVLLPETPFEATSYDEAASRSTTVDALLDEPASNEPSFFVEPAPFEAGQIQPDRSTPSTPIPYKEPTRSTSAQEASSQETTDPEIADPETTDLDTTDLDETGQEADIPGATSTESVNPWESDEDWKGDVRW